MVQLPATAAIEYVAACWVSGTGGIFVREGFCPGELLSGGLLPGGTFVWGAYARSPQVQCVYTPSRLSVPSNVAWRTNRQKNKQTKNRQTRPPSSAGNRPPHPKFSGYVEVEAHYIFHPSTIWIRPLFTELGPKPPQKSRFCHEANEYMSPSGDINNNNNNKNNKILITVKRHGADLRHRLDRLIWSSPPPKKKAKIIRILLTVNPDECVAMYAQFCSHLIHVLKSQQSHDSETWITFSMFLIHATSKERKR